MRCISINGKKIGDGSEPFIIAEAGINHNGEMELAKKMILAAKAANVDAVKFQTFYAKDFIQDRTLMYTYSSQGKEITEVSKEERLQALCGHCHLTFRSRKSLDCRRRLSQ